MRSQTRQTACFRRHAAAAGILARHNIAASEVMATAAEDHYCRLFLTSEREALVPGRFGDLPGELREVEGARVHPGPGVSDAGVRSARRAGASWEAVLHRGSALHIDATYRAQARRRVWLHRRLSAVADRDFDGRSSGSRSILAIGPVRRTARVPACGREHPFSHQS